MKTKADKLKSSSHVVGRIRVQKKYRLMRNSSPRLQYHFLVFLLQDFLYWLNSFDHIFSIITPTSFFVCLTLAFRPLCLFLKGSKFTFHVSGKKRSQEKQKNKEISWRNVSKWTVLANTPPKHSFSSPSSPDMQDWKDFTWITWQWLSKCSLFHRVIKIQILNHHLIEEPWSLSQKLKPWWANPNNKSAVSTWVTCSEASLQSFQHLHQLWCCSEHSKIDAEIL